MKYNINFYYTNFNYKTYLKRYNEPDIRIEKSNIQGHCQFDIILQNLINTHNIPLKDDKDLTLKFEIEDRNFILTDYQDLYKDVLDFSFNLEENSKTTIDNYEVRYELPWEISWYMRAVIKWNDLFSQTKYFNAILTSNLGYNSKIISNSIYNKKFTLFFTSNNPLDLNNSICLSQVFYIQHLKIKKLKAFITFLVEFAIGGFIGALISIIIT